MSDRFYRDTTPTPDADVVERVAEDHRIRVKGKAGEPGTIYCSCGWDSVPGNRDMVRHLVRAALVAGAGQGQASVARRQPEPRVDKYPPVPASLAVAFASGEDATREWHRYCDQQGITAQPAPVSAEQVEAAVQAAYFQIAAEQTLTITPVGEGRAQVPAHWRAEAEARALPILRAAGIEVSP